MVKLAWGLPGQRFFEAGVDRGVFYPRFSSGVPWNGLINIEEGVSGGEHEPLHYDGVKYLDILASEDFVATIEAFSSPEGFAACEGKKEIAQGLFATHQPRVPFDLSYRTGIGNDLNSTVGHKIHLVYNATAVPEGVSHQTLGESVEPGSRSWSIETVPPLSPTYKPTAHLIIDTRSVVPSALAALEASLYGSPEANTPEAHMPTQAEVVAMLQFAPV